MGSNGNLATMPKELKLQYKESLRRLDDNVTELEEIYEEMDKYLYDLEKRIARLRRSNRA